MLWGEYGFSRADIQIREDDEVNAEVFIASEKVYNSNY